MALALWCVCDVITVSPSRARLARYALYEKPSDVGASRALSPATMTYSSASFRSSCCPPLAASLPGNSFVSLPVHMLLLMWRTYSNSRTYPHIMPCLRALPWLTTLCLRRSSHNRHFGNGKRNRSPNRFPQGNRCL